MPRSEAGQRLRGIAIYGGSKTGRHIASNGAPRRFEIESVYTSIASEGEKV